MSSRGAYDIGDEQRTTGYAVSPLWPLLALMFAGGWMAWPWAIMNSFWLDSPTRRQEILWSAAGAVGSMVIAAAILIWANEAQAEAEAVVRLRYALIVLAVYKLACGYRVYLLQSRTLELYEFYGGRLRNALPLVLLGFVFRSSVAGFLPAAFLRLALT